MSVAPYIIEFMKEVLEPHKLMFLAEKIAIYMHAQCEECMRDRITCALRPFCPEREYLNILIESGAPEKLLPQFCYFNQKKEIMQYLNGKTTLRVVRDAKLPLLDFIDIICVKKKRKELREALAENNYVAILDTITGYLKSLHGAAVSSLIDHIGVIISKEYNNIIIIDFNKKLVNINLERDYITDLRVVIETLNMLCDFLGLTCKISKSFGTLTYLETTFLVNESIDWSVVKRHLSELKRNLKKIVAFSRTVSSKEKREIKIQVSVLGDSGENYIDGNKIKAIFKEITGFKKHIEEIKMEEKVR